MPASTAFSLATQERTGKTLYYGTRSEVRTLKITRGNCLVSITNVSGIYGDITISYTLKNDRETVCSMKPYYSLDGGSNYYECTKGTGGDEKTSLITSSAGTSHSFVWDTFTDCGNGYKGDVLLMLKAFDKNSYKGDFMNSQIYNISVNNAPDSCTLLTPSSGYFQKDTTPEFICTIPTDPNPANTYGSLHVKLEIDETADFNSSALIVFESRNNTDGWEYENSSSAWVQIPETGIPVSTALVGNSVRYVVDSENELSRSSLFWSITFGQVV